MRCRALTVLSIAVLIPLCAQGQEYTTSIVDLQAKDYFEKQQYKQVVDLCDNSTGNKNLYCNLLLAHMYVNGLGVEADQAKAMHNSELAATKGDRYAMSAVGNIYREGLLGVKKDLNKAEYWFKKAWDKGEETAGIGLVRLYDEKGKKHKARQQAKLVFKQSSRPTQVWAALYVADSRFRSYQSSDREYIDKVLLENVVVYAKFVAEKSDNKEYARVGRDLFEKACAELNPSTVLEEAKSCPYRPSASSSPSRTNSTKEEGVNWAAVGALLGTAIIASQLLGDDEPDNNSSIEASENCYETAFNQVSVCTVKDNFCTFSPCEPEYFCSKSRDGRKPPGSCVGFWRRLATDSEDEDYYCDTQNPDNQSFELDEVLEKICDNN